MHPTASWERQPDEQPHVYEAAQWYFDMGPHRSLRKVADHFGYNRSTVQRWSVRHHWQERARDYDAHLVQVKDNERRAVLEEAARTEAHKWNERLQLEREEEWKTAQALLAKAREMLACSLEETKWNWRDAVVMIDQAAKLVRIAAGTTDEDDGEAHNALTIRVEYAGEDSEEPGPHDSTGQA
jgi:hypothetical protein